MRRFFLTWAAPGIIAVALAFVLSTERRHMAIETPNYQLLSSNGNVEIRQYAAHMVASVEMTGSQRESLYKGFRVLADYIFGNNRSQSKVAMTAPVGVQPAAEKIAMTAPVGIVPTDNRWRVTFVMPSAYTRETIPLPNDGRVKLEEVPAQKLAAWTFSGWATEGHVEKNRRLFVEALKAQGLSPAGKMQLAQYDPPWSFPFFRRNEWLVAVP